MITRIQSPTGITSRGPTVDDADFDISFQERDTVITPGSTVTSTVDDRNITTNTAATVDRAGDVEAEESVIGTFTPFLRYESLDPSIATVDSVGNLTRVSDGTARIVARTALRKKLVSVPVSRQTATTVVFNGYVTGSLARNCGDAVDTRIAGKTAATAKPIFSTANHDAGTYVRNTNCWAANLDLTCVSPWNSAGGISYAGTAISSRHIIFARHFQIPTNATIRFITTDNQVVTRTMTAKQSLSGSDATTDLTIGLLDSALPASITPAKVLPANTPDYLPSIGRVYAIPALAIDREENALITCLYQLTGDMARFQSPSNATRVGYYEPLISGDSGNPAFLIIDNEPVLITTWTFGGAGGGPRIHALHTEINAAMTTLGGGQQLSVKSLSAFTDYS
jgi:hypothetical protein